MSFPSDNFEGLEIKLKNRKFLNYTTSHNQKTGCVTMCSLSIQYSRDLQNAQTSDPKAIIVMLTTH